MDLAGRMQQLEEMVRDAKSMPLSSSALLNRDEVLEMLAEMQESLPEEIKQARWIVKDREELLGKARQDAERIVEQAREDQLRMARKEDIVHRAEEEADRIVAEAEQQAHGRPCRGRELRRRAGSRSSRSRSAGSSRRRSPRPARSRRRWIRWRWGATVSARRRPPRSRSSAADPEAQLFDAEEER